MNRTTFRRAGITTIASAVLAAGVGLARAAIPDDQGLITGCYNSTSGALRVIDAGKTKFASSERALTWNQRGVAGPAGPAGAVGPAGPAGVPGPAGVSGYELQESSEITVAPGAPLAHWEHCSAGKLALGGGYYVNRDEAAVVSSMPLLDDGRVPVGWEASVVNTSTQFDVYLRVYAICATVG